MEREIYKETKGILKPLVGKNFKRNLAVGALALGMTTAGLAWIASEVTPHLIGEGKINGTQSYISQTNRGPNKGYQINTRNQDKSGESILTYPFGGVREGSVNSNGTVDKRDIPLYQKNLQYGANDYLNRMIQEGGPLTHKVSVR